MNFPLAWLKPRPVHLHSPYREKGGRRKIVFNILSFLLKCVMCKFEWIEHLESAVFGGDHGSSRRDGRGHGGGKEETRGRDEMRVGED